MPRVISCLHHLALFLFTVGVREQMNQVSSYIDLSNIYSTSEKELGTVLRDKRGGYLRSRTETDGRYMLHRSEDPEDGCNRPEMLATDRTCFRSGNQMQSASYDKRIVPVSNYKHCCQWHLFLLFFYSLHRWSEGQRIHRPHGDESSVDARTQPHHRLPC